MNILVTGGAGYIGSHMVKLLAGTGSEVTVLDDLSTGHAEAVRGAQFVRGDIADVAATKSLLQKNRIEAVVHFAASSLVGRVDGRSAQYYRRNVGGTVALVQAMRDAGVGAHRVLLHRRGVRRPGAHADRRDASDAAGQSLRREQARHGAHARGLQRGLRHRRRGAALTSTPPAPIRRASSASATTPRPI
jgi:uncharacterized protein YbjT (DUF2867 family)